MSRSLGAEPIKQVYVSRCSKVFHSEPFVEFRDDVDQERNENRCRQEADSGGCSPRSRPMRRARLECRRMLRALDILLTDWGEATRRLQLGELGQFSRSPLAARRLPGHRASGTRASCAAQRR